MKVAILLLSVVVLSQAESWVAAPYTLDEILVTADAAGLQRLRGQLLELVGRQVDGEGELVHTGLLTSEIIDPDLGVGDTTVESALGIGLILAVAIALGRSPTHLYFSCRSESSNISLVV